jgi:hypothetical protein
MVTLIQNQVVARPADPGTKKVFEYNEKYGGAGESSSFVSRHPGCENEVAVLLSGGVDSSVALKLLLLQGYKVRAFYLKIWLEDEVAHLNECPWEEDLGYAQSVCEQLNVPLETLVSTYVCVCVGVWAAVYGGACVAVR